MVGARVLDTARDNHEINVRLLNPGEGPVRLHRGTVLGYVECVARVHETLATSVVRNVTERKQDGQAENKALIEKLIRESDLTSEEEKIQTRRLLCEYQDRFPADGTLGRSGIVKHEIRTGGAPPRAVQPTRVDQSTRRQLDSMVEDMLKQDVIRPSVSPFAARVVPVEKKMVPYDSALTIVGSMQTPSVMPSRCRG